MKNKFINRKTVYICVFFLLLPYIFRVLNIDFKIIHFFKDQKELSNIDQIKNKDLFYIKIGYVEFYPYTFTNDKKVADGLFVNKMNRIIDEYKKLYNQNIIFSFNSLPAKRLFEGLRTGDVHIFIGIRTIPELQSYTESGKNVFGKIELRAYFLNTNSYKKTDFDNLDKLNNKTIILISGYGYSGLADKIKKNYKIKHMEALDHHIAFEMLIRKRGDILLEYKEPAEDIINQYKYENLNYIELMNLDCYIIITKQLKNYKDLLEKLDNIFLKIQNYKEGVK